MYLCHRIGERINSNFNTLTEILRADGPISFDGIYESVWDNRKFLKEFPHKITLFVMGKYVGATNSFDEAQPYSLFLDWNHIIELAWYLKADIGWHTWSHAPLDALSDENILKEITPPFPMKLIAYPAGITTPRVIELCKQVGYEDGYCAGHRGDDTHFKRKRPYINW